MDLMVTAMALAASKGPEGRPGLLAVLSADRASADGHPLSNPRVPGERS